MIRPACSGIAVRTTSTPSSSSHSSRSCCVVVVVLWEGELGGAKLGDPRRSRPAALEAVQPAEREEGRVQEDAVRLEASKPAPGPRRPRCRRRRSCGPAAASALAGAARRRGGAGCPRGSSRGGAVAAPRTAQTASRQHRAARTPERGIVTTLAAVARPPSRPDAFLGCLRPLQEGSARYLISHRESALADRAQRDARPLRRALTSAISGSS